MNQIITRKPFFRATLILLVIAGSLLAKTPALHPLFQLLDDNGQSVLETGKPLSTINTCGSCHDTEYIQSHSQHSDAGLSTMGSDNNKYPWDNGRGYFGGWNPIHYRYLSMPGDSLTDLNQGSWVQTLGSHHVGGGPAEFDINNNRLDKTDAHSDWDWQASGVVEMNCFLCHMPEPDNKERTQALNDGNFKWANSATLIHSKVLTKKGENYVWNAEAFNHKGEVKLDYLTPTDPSNSNCGQCHGAVYTPGELPHGLSVNDWNTTTTGEIIAPQKIDESGLNIKDKDKLHRSWDVHAERAVECVDCHPSENNPIYRRDSENHKINHLIFDARRIDVVDYLYRPSHEFAMEQRGEDGGEMRSCNACHDPNVVHNWLPYKESHFEKLSCESCHIPSLHGPAYEQVDWTVLTDEKTSSRKYRGTNGDPSDLTTLLEGFKPILLPEQEKSGITKLAPYNLVSSWYWVYGNPARPVRLADLEKAYFDGDNYRDDILAVFDANGDKNISNDELKLDSAEKEKQVRHNLNALGLTHLEIKADVQSYRVSHDVTNGKWATRECSDCHGETSRIGASYELANYLPGGIIPDIVGTLALDKMGAMTQNDNGSLSFALDISENGLYVFGLSSVTWVDWLGILIFIATILALAVHATFRIITVRGNSFPQHATKKVYMYTFYERLWHWIQVMAIVILLLTGFIIHKPEMFGFLAFPYMVIIHNAMGFILFANAFLAVFYHVVSGEIKQYIPKPHGFFDQAVLQAGYYVQGIFKGAPHPFEKTPAKKLNPLQQMTYFGLLNFLLPFQIITGLIIWSMQMWPSVAEALGGLPILGPVHTFLAWLFATFIVLHAYLTTTGHKPLDGIRAMIDGWDEVEEHNHNDKENN